MDLKCLRRKKFSRFKYCDLGCRYIDLLVTNYLFWIFTSNHCRIAKNHEGDHRLAENRSSCITKLCINLSSTVIRGEFLQS